MNKWIYLICYCPLLLCAAPKKALIFGVTGQDGAYLTEFLLSKDYEVHGVKRRSSSHNTDRVDHLYRDPHGKTPRFFLHYGDLSDASNVIRLIETIKPDEIYNLAAQSHVRLSFEVSEYTANIDALGTLRILEAIRHSSIKDTVRFYQASSSEMYGKVQAYRQSETTPFYPRSPYAVAKLFSHWITINYREAYNIFACNGILFNHESPLRGETFVTKKVAAAAARIKYGEQDCLYLGNLEAMRDWGFAGDYVEAMWLILQQDSPDDYTIGMGETHSVREFVEKAFAKVGITILWEGEGADEVGIDRDSGKVIVRIDPQYYRPTEVEFLLADPTKAKEKLGWKPTKSFDDLIDCMMEYELQKFEYKG